MSFIKQGAVDPSTQLRDSETLSRLASDVACGAKASFGSEEIKARAARFLSDAEILRRTQEMMFILGRTVLCSANLFGKICNTEYNTIQF